VFERFGVDHVGVYLLDERRQYAVLQAAPSEAGKRMLVDNYRVSSAIAVPLDRPRQPARRNCCSG